MGRIVIACYKPKGGQEATLEALVREHVPILRSRGLATERRSIVGRAKDGTLVEVFEWVSPEAVEKAHHDEVVAELWARFQDVCDYSKIGSLDEAQEMWSEFEALD